jgi:hypothetical protein
VLVAHHDVLDRVDTEHDVGAILGGPRLYRRSQP